jgi:hypothetical protein
VSSSSFHLSDSTDVEVRQYRPLSVLALLSLLVGAVSGVALLAAPLWLVPILGVVLAVAALQSAAVRQRAAGGRSLAIAGLLLSTLFLSLAVGRSVSYRQQIYREGRQVAGRWMQRVAQGELEIAHQATLPPYRRQISAFGLQRAYQANPELMEQKEEFFDQPIVAMLVQSGRSAKWQFLQSVQQTVDGRSCYVVLRYVISGSQTEPLEAEVLLQRYDAWQDDPASWQVMGLAPAESSDS